MPKKTKAGKTTPKLSFAVGPHKIPVIFDYDIDGATGYFITDKAGPRIVVYPDQGDSHTNETILHELVHALDYYMGLNLDHSQVHGLGTGLAQALAPFLK